MKILAWDLECSGLNADFGIILCCGFGEVGKSKVEVFNILDYRGADTDLIRAEKRLLKDISARLLEADVWLTHYGTWFDLPFVNSRLLYHKLPVLPPNFSHLDTWKISRNRLKLRSNRLITISEFLGTDHEKNAIRPEQWIRALGGHRASMDYIVDHCRLDIDVLREAYGRLRPLVLDHPNRGLVDGRGGCSVCGAKKLHARGFHITRTRKYQRYQCQSCGAWSKSVKPIMVLRG
jgi:uncharacterized protein YprB with RNaseH-like and TPR domain